MTEGQINRAIELFSAQLRKHAVELPSEAVQQVLGQSKLASEWFEVFRRRVEMMSSMIVRHVKEVDRTCSPQQMLDATGRKQYTDRDVVATMPRGEGDGEGEVVFFKPGRELANNAELEQEYELRGLKPVDPYSLAEVNKDDPAFADTHPNATILGDNCYAAFDRWDGDERNVRVFRHGGGWSDDWWFAGLRKS